MPPAIIGGVIAGAGALGSAAIGSSAAKGAAAQSAQATQLSIAEQRAAREQLVKLLQPWTQGGQGALAQQMALLGLNGATQQQTAVNQFQQSPMFQSLARQGEDAILQNASATGGLRGGNVQGALAQFRPALLNQQLQQQYQNLAGLSALGQSSAAGVGSGGMAAASNIGNLQMANATNQANAGLVGANAYGQAFGQIGNLAGRLFGGMGGPSAGTIGALTPSAFNTIAANPSIF